MKSEMRQSEHVVKEGSANLQSNIESIGGKLYLTNQRLLFEAHKANMQQFTTEIELSQISSTKKSWTKFLDFLQIMPNSLSVFIGSGNEYRFVLFGRNEWAAELDVQRNA